MTLPRSLGAAALAVLAASAPAQERSEAPRLAAPFTDGCVLQRDAPIVVWGRAEPEETVTLVLGERIASVRADVLGRFRAALEPMPASASPRPLFVHGRRATARIDDVRIGDVWLCAGDGGLGVPPGRDRDAAGAPPPEASGAPIRVLDLATSAPPRPGAFDAEALAACRPDRYLAGVWRPLEGSALPPELAAFASALALERGVPIGVIRAEVPGAPVEAWLRRELYEGALELDARVGSWLGDPRLPAACRARAAENLAGWMDAVLAASEAGALPPDTPGHPYQPGFLRAAAIEPLSGLRAAGVVWRHGRAHAADPGLFEPLTATVLSDLLAALGASRAVLVQVGPPPPGDSGGGWALLREAQRRVADDEPRAALAVSLFPDGGAAELGRRIARAALDGADGEGPLPAASLVGEGRMLLRFRGAGSGLAARGGGPLVGFEVAGPDGAFAPAGAEIVGSDLVRVASDAVPDPRRVRYAFGPRPEGNLESGEGLPASPFEVGS